MKNAEKVVKHAEVAEWARRAAGGLTLREIKRRTGISHTTAQWLLDGQYCSAQTIIRFGAAFGEDVAKALEMAGYGDIAEVWRAGVPIRPVGEDREWEEMLECWQRLPPGCVERKALLTLVRSLCGEKQAGKVGQNGAGGGKELKT